MIFLFFSFFSKVLYLITALFPGLHWTDNVKVWGEIRKAKYAGRHNPVLRLILRAAKLYACSLAGNLEQIEFRWCPIKHLERIHESEHHRNFCDADHLPDLYRILETKGSVSPKKPKY